MQRHTHLYTVTTVCTFVVFDTLIKKMALDGNVNGIVRDELWM